MTVPNGNEPQVQGQETGTEPPVVQQEQENAFPWAQYLEPLPESVRPLVEPAFKQWDADVTKRFQSLHSEYEPYKKFIADYEPDAIEQALGAMEFLTENPQEFLKQVLAANPGLQLEQGTTSQQPPATPEPDDDDPYGERFGKLEDMLGALAQVILGQQQTAQQAQEEAQLDQMITDLHTKHGDFDEVYVLTMMQNGMSAEQGIQAYQQAVQAAASRLNEPQTQAPTVVSQQGGGYPQAPVTSEDLNDAATRKSLVAQMLAAAAQQQG